MPKQNDLSRCLTTLEQDATLIAVVEMGQSSWLVAGIVPGLERNILKKLAADRDALLQRWLRAYAIEAHVIHPSSVPAPREHRRAKTDRLDT